MTAPVLKLKVAFRTCRRTPEPLEAPKQSGPTAIARRLALAHYIDDAIERGTIASYAEAATRLALTRARLTQIANLALLAPDIQAAVLLGHVEPRDRHLHAIGRHHCWTNQRRAFLELFPNVNLENEDDEG